ncbi:hypothetical protein CKY39_07660 [Variovorax boronicumulans]|uniref:SH3 domain-containing protein n=2 Tax=Variovorax boronicumulans TaxID=436515 RepID=A0A250DFH1_9BURK|nr:hypothetical protein CKY39_07660 [Variovorax boronicumulans]
MRFVVVAQHRSEYPQPIYFAKGSLIAIGDKYEGPEGWDNWYLCRTPDSKEGWVPGQIIEHFGPNSGKALEDYTALERDVDAGDVLIGARVLNGWVWCRLAGHRGDQWKRLAVIMWRPASEALLMRRTAIEVSHFRKHQLKPLAAAAAGRGPSSEAVHVSPCRSRQADHSLLSA